MKIVINKLYYSFRIGGPYYIGLRITDKIFRSDKAKRFLYLKSSEQKAEEIENFLIKIYGSKTGKKLNFRELYTFNEKMQWLKLYDNIALKTTLTDKYLVRAWIKEKIGERYLIPLLGVWRTFEEIDIDKLPKSFVLKANHGSGWNVIIKNKEKEDWTKVREKFNEWINLNFAFMVGFEMQYFNIEPRIIAEEYIENGNNNLFDYKIHCFGGKPEYIHVIGDRNFETHCAKEAFYNREWVLQPFITGAYSRYDSIKEKPVHLEEMLQIAEKLSEGFIYVRVDLYELDDEKIKFGEMTFTPYSGFYEWEPSETDKVLGEKIKLNL